MCRNFTSKLLHRTGYVTDIEGDYQFWRRYLNLSKVLDAPSGATGPISLREGCSFVFGGDSVDKGGMDLAVLRDLLSLKDKYPARVHFILGNRDINKMRFREELGLSSVRSHPGTYWRPGSPASSDSFSAASTDKVNIAKWMLQNTMGCPHTFELRRLELAKERGGAHVCDDDVANSILRSVTDLDGELANYLKRADLAVVVNDVLFVHGAVWEGSLGVYPDHADGKESWKQVQFEGPNRPPSPVLTWASKLNAWAHSEVDAFLTAAQGTLAAGERAPLGTPWAATGGFVGSPGSGLLQYGMGLDPNRSRVPGCVYANSLQKGAPVLMKSKVRDALVSSGITTVVSGHQPFGDAPLVIANGNLRVITADTSFSNDQKWDFVGGEARPRVLPPVSNSRPSPQVGNGTRGHAVAEVVFESGGGGEDGGRSITNVHGVLSNGEAYDYTMPTPSKSNTCLIGREVSDGWWARVLLSDGKVVLSKGEGYACTNRVVAESWAWKQLEQGGSTG